LAILSLRYNFQRTLNQHYNYGRTYATGDEGGVVTGTYPRGRKPSLPFPYQSECWTGLEYAFARLLLDYGFKREALQVVQAIRARHDGAKRNPFNEPECGSYYARSMSAWSLVEDR
jgi:non-lysosomal glucosylceramidase